jgi:hypothetical protein
MRLKLRKSKWRKTQVGKAHAYSTWTWGICTLVNVYLFIMCHVKGEHQLPPVNLCCGQLMPTPRMVKLEPVHLAPDAQLAPWPILMPSDFLDTMPPILIIGRTNRAKNDYESH